MSIKIYGQELNCRIEVNSDQIQGTNKQVFNTLQQSLTEFMNGRKWTNIPYSENERIDCSITFVIKEMPSANRYKGELQIQARRPVYNSSYITTLLNHKDANFEFPYQEFESLQFSNNSFDNNLTGTMAFYAYLIIGLDSDSFSPLGGTPFFTHASEIATMAQSSMEAGWKAFESNRNRHALITAFTDEKNIPFRQYWYEYHRKGLDEMILSVDRARGRIGSGMSVLTNLQKQNSQSILFPLFMDSKLNEVINIYSKAPAEEKEGILKLLQTIYPTQRNRLNEAFNSK